MCAETGRHLARLTANLADWPSAPALSAATPHGQVLQVVNRFQDEGDGVAGTSKSQIVAHWPDTSAPSADAVQAGIASLVNSGHIFATIDDEHFRAT